jgi:hypothetical protein
MAIRKFLTALISLTGFQPTCPLTTLLPSIVGQFWLADQQ